jgi:ABC-type lipoprotein export system ATPase subunit
VLRGVDLSVRPRDVLVIMGPSGSGTSTLLRVVSHLAVLGNSPEQRAREVLRLVQRERVTL